MFPTGESLASIAQHALKKAHADPHDNPRSIARRLGLRLFPRNVLGDPQPYKLLGPGSYWYRWLAEDRAKNLNACLGMGAVLLVRNSILPTAEAVLRIVGRILIPDLADFDLGAYPYIPEDFLLEELWRRRSNLSGIHLVSTG